MAMRLTMLALACLAVVGLAGAASQRIHTDGLSLNCTNGQVIKWVNGAPACGDDLTGGAGSAAWGGITGTLSNQTDLQNALNAKAASSHAHAQADVTNLTTDLAGKAPSATTCNATEKLRWTGAAWECVTDQTGGGGSIPAGSILLVASGGCPTGFAEVAALNGRMPLGTLAANGDVGTTGGSDTIADVLNHTHGVMVTDPGHAHVQGVNSATTGGLSGYAPDTSSNTRVNSGYSTSSATTGISASTANPSGGVASIDNRSAFARVIFCQKS